MDLRRSSLHDFFDTGKASSCHEKKFSSLMELMVPQNSSCHELIVAGVTGVTNPENDPSRTEMTSRLVLFLLVLLSQMSQIRVLKRLLTSVETLVIFSALLRINYNSHSSQIWRSFCVIFISTARFIQF